MAEEKIRVGFIGAGGNTRKLHIPGFKKQAGVELAGVANRTRQSGQSVADEFAIPQVYDDWQALLDDDSIDAVCIGTWPYMHAPLTIAALEAGKHVLCEARMAMDHNQALAMYEASLLCPAQRAQIVPAPHTLAFDRTIIEMVSAGYIGDLISIDARIAANRSYPDSSARQHWRQNRQLSGDNVMNMGIWYEAMMRWVGPAKSVMAVGQTVVRHRLDDAGRRTAMEIPDHIDVVGAMAQGGQMRFNVSAVLGHAPDLADVYLFGTDGTIRLHQPVDGAMTLSAAKRGQPDMKVVDIDPAKRGGWRVEEEFINAIRGKEPVTHTDFATGVRYMEWTTAVSRSLHEAQAVMLPL
ncbi:MAG: Gfo/Idh/MocA family oxidoreductase [Hyphomicrobiaceae bacterium]